MVPTPFARVAQWINRHWPVYRRFSDFLPFDACFLRIRGFFSNGRVYSDTNGFSRYLLSFTRFSSFILFHFTGQLSVNAR